MTILVQRSTPARMKTLPLTRLKLPQFKFHPLVDPAFVYLSAFFLFVGALIVGGNAYLVGDPNSPSSFSRSSLSGHRQFPAENDVRGIVRDGQTEDDVLNECGTPFSRGTLDDGVTILNYVMPMSQTPANDTSLYCGFSVYLKSGKVQDVNIIRGSDLRNKGER